jgi:signal transduction histidine kinase
MPTNDSVASLIFVVTLFAIVSLSVLLSIKIKKLRKLQSVVDGLKKSFDDMDEQAKLIVRTDIELNKLQEELDKKISGLYALQRLSRSISTTLEESQIFQKVSIDDLRDLGFEKAIAFSWSIQDKKFTPRMNLGYSPEETEIILSFIQANKETCEELIEKEQPLSSISHLPDPSLRENIKKIFRVRAFVISPVLPREGDRGFIFVGTNSAETLMTEGDEELITILANQLGQALENARLFEKTWIAQQALEKKVEERTRQLSGALDEVKKVSKRKTDFVSSVSHELRTPLTSIKGYAAILLAGKLGSVPQEIKERLQKINRHSDELVHMINDLLDISRIESGRMTMQQEQLSLKDVLDKIQDMLAVQLKEKRIEFSVDIPANTNKIFADRNQIERVFTNIIWNAIKFTPEKGKITVGAHKEGDFVQVDIADTGCGIPESALDAIFEEFYRVDNSINEIVKGTGLGLALVKNIIEAHKGKIWVMSKEGKGSTFSFTLPQGK